MTYLLTTAAEDAIYYWLTASLPDDYTVIWADPKLAGDKAPRPAYPYAVAKITTVGEAPLGAPVRILENRLTVTAADTTTSAIVAGETFTVTVTPPATKTTTAIAAELAALIDAGLSSTLDATSSGAVITLTPKTGQQYTVTNGANITSADYFTHKVHGNFTLSVQIYSATGDHLAAAMAIVNGARMSAQMKLLRDAGLGFWGADAPVDLTFLDGPGFVNRAQIDLRFGYAETVTEQVQQIDRIITSATITTERETEIDISDDITG